MLELQIVRTSPELFLPCLLKETDTMENSSSVAVGSSLDDEYFQDASEYDDQYPVYMLVASQGDCVKLKVSKDCFISLFADFLRAIWKPRTKALPDTNVSFYG